MSRVLKTRRKEKRGWRNFYSLVILTKGPPLSIRRRAKMKNRDRCIAAWSRGSCLFTLLCLLVGNSRAVVQDPPPPSIAPITVQERFQLVAHVAVRLADGKDVPASELGNISSAIVRARYGDFEQILRVALLVDYMAQRLSDRAATFLDERDSDIARGLKASMYLVFQAKIMSMDLAGKGSECDKFLERKLLVDRMSPYFDGNPISVSRGELIIKSLRMKPIKGFMPGPMLERTWSIFSDSFIDQHLDLIKSFWRELDGGEEPPAHRSSCFGMDPTDYYYPNQADIDGVYREGMR